ncbi:25386_t:CDS:1, partial [Racocetra persica]
DRCHIISPFGPINYLPFDPTICSLSASCTTLGCVSNMNDKILEWAYKKAVEESPENFPIYLYEIFKLSIERK